MKAAQISEYGDPSVVIVNDISKPSVGNGKVLIKVHAASLNPFDTSVRSGAMQQMIPLELPVTLGGDIAGVIEEIGADVTDFVPGDEVYGQANAVAGNSGAFAEYALTQATQIAKKPGGLDFKEASSLPLVGVSALQGLKEHINLQPGQKILIHGGSGGIGSIAVKIAKHMGAYVAATASTDAVDYVMQLGADEVIDYKSQDFQELIHDYDAVFDTVGGDTFLQSYHVLKPGGIAVSMIAPVNDDAAKERGISAYTQSTRVTTVALDELNVLIASGVVVPNIAKVFSIDEIQDAFKVREADGVVGKIVLDIV